MCTCASWRRKSTGVLTVQEKFPFLSCNTRAAAGSAECAVTSACCCTLLHSRESVWLWAVTVIMFGQIITNNNRSAGQLMFRHDFIRSSCVCSCSVTLNYVQISVSPAWHWRELSCTEKVKQSSVGKEWVRRSLLVTSSLVKFYGAASLSVLHWDHVSWFSCFVCAA